MQDHSLPDAGTTKTASTGVLTFLCVTYVVLLLYASLMPFDMSLNWDRALDGYQRAWHFWPFKTTRHTSRADILSNLLLYIPCAFLLATRLLAKRTTSRWFAFAASVFVCATIGFLVETGQLFSRSRTPSATDVIMNTAGGIFGAAMGVFLGVQLWDWFRAFISEQLAENPITLVVILLLLVLAADALYPYLPTLDLHDVKQQLKTSALQLEEGLQKHSWHHWLVQRVGAYAVLTALLAAAMRKSSSLRWGRAAGCAIMFVLIAEFAKLFIISRSANVANVVTSGAGIGLGMALGYSFAPRKWLKLRSLLPIILLVGYITYLELTPFNFTFSFNRIIEEMPRGVELLPLYHYAWGARAEDVRLFLTSLVMLGSLTYAISMGWRWFVSGSVITRYVRAALLGACIGLLLESCQLFLDSRTASVTDVFCFALGALLGAWAFRNYAVASRP